MKFAIAALLSVAGAVKLQGDPVSWDKNTLPTCPDAPRTVMDDGKTHVTKYPFVGASCKLQIGETTLIMTAADPVAPKQFQLEHCPDFDERMTLTDGKTRAVPFPQKGYNCNKDWSLAQHSHEPKAPKQHELEHCPDFDERFTLVDGKTRAVPFPKKGYNCSASYSLNQHEPHAPKQHALEHCPDFDERMTLVDGKTKAVPFPQKGYNCSNSYSLVGYTI